jgi:hypothetical protein
LGREAWGLEISALIEEADLEKTAMIGGAIFRIVRSQTTQLV